MSANSSKRHVIVEELAESVECWELARRMDDQEYLFLLDSGAGGSELGRYSVLAWQPRWEFIAKDGAARSGPPGQTRPLIGGVLEQLDRTLRMFTKPVVTRAGDAWWPPAFTGGAVGFLAYELLHEIEVVSPNVAEDLGVADCHLLFCDVALVSDVIAGRSWLISNGWGDSEEASRRECLTNLQAARAACANGAAEHSAENPTVEHRWDRLASEDLVRHRIRAVTERDRYLELVEQARQHILAGDVFELCLTQRFDTEVEVSGAELYAAMRSINPAPMGAYLRLPELEVLSSSPERLLRLDSDGWVETRPIKGTRPRGRTPLEDAALALDLATAVKDGAENMMIVDLARNDLGRVCEFGTVSVPNLRAVETHPSVFQLVSTIRGRLRAGVTAVDLLRAAFPGGSMTGAPKIQAMRLIAEMEDSRRGIFSGAIGYLNYSGELDLNVVIRTAVKRGEHVCFHTGGAITADSIPADEYQETLDKACAIVRAIDLTRAATRERATVQ